MPAGHLPVPLPLSLPVPVPLPLPRPLPSTLPLTLTLTLTPTPTLPLQVTYRAIDYDDGRSTLDAAGVPYPYCRAGVPLAVRVVSAEVVTSREQGAP